MANNEVNKYWLSISKCCNNQCIFCHDVDNQRVKDFIPYNLVTEEIDLALAQGSQRLILSGGEASIHPDFIKIISYAKGKGFKEIQTITNGRYFYYIKLLKEAVEAGLTEITFSIHGHKAQLHDYLTGVPGSFVQVLKALDNIKIFPDLIVNIDIVINNFNYKYLREIIRFFADNYGIYEYDLLQIVPYGRAYDNRELLFYDLNEALPYLRQVFELAKNDKRYFIWTNRLPAPYLEDYEFLIQDPGKILDEIGGREETFNNYLQKNIKLPCTDEFRCAHCFLQDFCKKLQLYQENKNTESLNYIEADKNNWQQLMVEQPSAWIKIKNFPTLLAVREKGLSSENLKELQQLKKMKFLNLPPCLSPNSEIKQDFLLNYNKVLGDNKQIELSEFTQKYVEDLYYVKSLRCNACRYNKQCFGWHINYIRQYGFKILQPIL